MGPNEPRSAQAPGPAATAPEEPTSEEPTSEEPTSPWPGWAARPEQSADEPMPSRVPVPPAWGATVGPDGPRSPITEDAVAPRGPSALRSALLGGVAGALVAALVATGVTVALDDDTSAPVDRPVVTPVTNSAGALDIQAILAKVQSSVVTIETDSPIGLSEGTGIVLSADGLVLTNAHVIGSIGDITVVVSDGTEHPATLVGSSPEDDLAVIRVDGVDDLVPADLGSSDDLRVGDEVIAIGNALDLGGAPTVTRGIVSAKERDLSAEGVDLEGLIQTDAAINPGNSGGPLVNSAGQVVGVNTAIVADAQRLGFSIAIDRVRSVIDDLESGRGAVTPDQAFLGVSSSELADLTSEVRTRFEIDFEEGAFVAEVVPGSAAEEAGLLPGDVIVEIDGDEITQATEVRDAILDKEPGDKIDITVIRRGEDQTVEAELDRRGDRS